MSKLTPEVVADELLELMHEDDSEKETFHCRVCETNFSSRKNLRRHKQRLIHIKAVKHKQALKTNKRHLSSLLLSNDGNIKKNNNRVSELQNKIKENGSDKAMINEKACRLCNSSFLHPFLMEIHKCELAAPSFSCHCGKAFTSKDELEFHNFFHNAKIQFISFN
ncbi:CLUMA_CG001322, isoform A [Clunio marinus]|uniref:CLUMA_CG001322, isoform A n=1 Tax=Clunio marinus TaxID=568069 RepID=A0A1J1HMQ6_9DIPT|nr:CLUMA_CG001322, isoform A [Clunio marinus]